MDFFLDIITKYIIKIGLFCPKMSTKKILLMLTTDKH
jgi:hypothetical protein